MDTNFILKQLSQNHSRRRSIRGDYDLNPDIQRPHIDLIPAAVLVPLVIRQNSITLLFTIRNKDLANHPGQVSFPGGQIDNSDETPEGTALREIKEEVGIDKKNIKVIGSLDYYETRTGFSVAPIVGFIYPPFTVEPNPREVAEVFEVPLSFLMNPENHVRHQKTFKGEIREFYAMPYNDYFIWGATAGMIVNLYNQNQRLDC